MASSTFKHEIAPEDVHLYPDTYTIVTPDGCVHHIDRWQEMIWQKKEYILACASMRAAASRKACGVTGCG
jgi:hypothetical protein